MYIYKVTCIINGHFYVGKSKFKPEENPEYFGSGNRHYKNALKKYGKHNFKKEILEICSSIEELNTKEKYWIAEYRKTCMHLMYNIAEGGDGGDTLTNHPDLENIKKKIKKNIAGKVSGHNNGFFGKHHSDETKEKISQKIKGKPSHRKGKTGIFSEETRKKFSMIHIGFKHSEESKKKISESRMGFKHSEESKKKMSEKRKGCSSLFDTWVQKFGIEIAQEKEKIRTSKISQTRANNKLKNTLN